MEKWKGHPLNNSDIGYEWDYEEKIVSGTTGPFNPVELDIEVKQSDNKKNEEKI